jgi:hypothetical protein
MSIKCSSTWHEAHRHMHRVEKPCRNHLHSHTMDTLDDSELWISEEEMGDGEEEEDAANSADPTFFQLEMERQGQSGGN